MSKLTDAVIGQIHTDFSQGDTTALEEMLKKLDKDTLINYLPEDRQEEATSSDYELTIKGRGTQKELVAELRNIANTIESFGEHLNMGTTYGTGSMSISVIQVEEQLN